METPAANHIMDETEQSLWNRYLGAKSLKARDSLRNQLVELYMPFAKRLAERKSRALPSSVELDDLISAVYQALIQSIPRFDPARRVAPATFLRFRIHGAIIDFLRSQDDASRLMRQRQKQINRWSTGLDHAPTDDEIYDHFGFRFDHPSVISLQETRLSQNGKEEALADLIADRRIGRADAGISELSHVLKGCDKRERLILMLYYLEGESMADIGRSLGISESRVSQKMKSLMARLRAAA